MNRFMSALFISSLGFLSFAYANSPASAYFFAYPSTLPDDVVAFENDILNNQQAANPNTNLGMILKVAQFSYDGSQYKAFNGAYCNNPTFGPFFNGCLPSDTPQHESFRNPSHFLALLNGLSTSNPYTPSPSDPSQLFANLGPLNLYFSGVVTDFETANLPLAANAESCAFYKSLVSYFNQQGLPVGITLSPSNATFDSDTASCLNSALATHAGLASGQSNYYIFMLYDGGYKNIATAVSRADSTPYRLAFDVTDSTENAAEIQAVQAFTSQSAHPNYQGVILYQYKPGAAQALPASSEYLPSPIIRGPVSFPSPSTVQKTLQLNPQ